jgi:uncharacterized protein (DUF1501 family)
MYATNKEHDMLRIHDPGTRRDFLRIGGLGFGSLALPSLLHAEVGAQAASFLRDRSVVFLFMHGGPPQTETFDPKMTAPAEYRCFNGEIKTALPGVTYGASMQGLARLADKIAVVRSFHTGDGAHNLKPIVSPHSLGANIGSVYSRIAGTTDEASGMPINAALFPRAVDDEALPRIKNFGDFADTGDLGAAYAPFIPSGEGPLMDNMRLRIPQARLDDRRALLASLDRFQRQLDASGNMAGIDKFNRQAYDVILGRVTKAFDLAHEDPAVVARYDTSALIPPDKIDKKWNNHRNYRDHGQTLGKLMLMARRLCEHGSRFITVTTNFVWDFHADKNNATLDEGMQYVGLPFDHAVSAFIEDVESRGLGDKILLVACGEMGRTPKINARGGRDHWGRLAPLLLYGGGLNMGQVVGRSDANAGEPNSDPVGIPDLIATIFHSMFDVSELRLEPGLPSSLMRLIESGKPIDALV